ncbi:delta-like protein 1 [Strongylocentrotus purpuratus]|uniref:EGF-like domain-containing protein n=1 Tax=Strongylocentrotus purpuratus TaxID=7668 RepID=A0A7M7NJI9_STRPU|nr:delta-like protein 1 [Strongylocentrotus purpuratus]
MCEIEIDACIASSEPPCANNGQCIDLRQGYRCVCQTGFTGTQCENDIPCTPDPCVNACISGTCINVGDTYTCNCPQGITGQFCESTVAPPLPCDTNPCLNGDCQNVGDTFFCICNDGFTGQNCESTVPPPLPCDSNPCINGDAWMTQTLISVSAMTVSLARIVRVHPAVHAV